MYMTVSETYMYIYERLIFVPGAYKSRNIMCTIQIQSQF